MYSPRQSAKDSSHFIEGKGKTSNEILFFGVSVLFRLESRSRGLQGVKSIDKVCTFAGAN